MTLVECSRFRGGVCMNHCPTCEYFEAISWHCLYYQDVALPRKLEAERAAAHAQHLKRKAQLRRAWLELLGN